jgi:CIC family chloride channel protein
MELILRRIVEYIKPYTGERNFVLLLSLIIGFFAGLTAVILKNLVHFTHHFLSGQLRINESSLLYFALPMIGIFLTWLFIRFFVKDSISHGITRVLYAISRKEGNLASHNTWSSLIASTLTVGFGGSVGLEAPIVMTGSALGSNLSRILGLPYRTTILLMGCGAAGAIAAIFKAPIAAIIFVLEVLLFDMTMASIIPLLIASVTATTVAAFLLGQGAEFSFTISEPFVLRRIPFYMLLGVFCGLVSHYFSSVALFVETRIGRISNPFRRILSGGVILGLLIYIFPPLYGEGYESLRSLLGGDPADMANQSFFFEYKNDFYIFVAYLLLVMFFKVVAMALTNGTGGVGGLFAPSLFMGGMAGYLLAYILIHFGFTDISARNFSLAGMAGLMAGVMHAPLTAIFLIAEITGGYQLIVPLIITATLSYLTIRYFEPHSIYHRRLAMHGDLITHHKDKAVLTLMKLEDLIENDFQPITPEMRLGELVNVMSTSKRNTYPVLDPDGYIVGIVLLEKIKHIIFDKDMYQMITVESLMELPDAYVYLQEGMEKVVNKFEDTGARILPVIDKGRYCGFVSKPRVYGAYRQMLREVSEE